MNKDTVTREDFIITDFEYISCLDLSSLGIDPFRQVSIMVIDPIISIILLPTPSFPESQPITNQLYTYG